MTTTSESTTSPSVDSCFWDFAALARAAKSQGVAVKKRRTSGEEAMSNPTQNRWNNGDYTPSSSLEVSLFSSLGPPLILHGPQLVNPFSEEERCQLTDMIAGGGASRPVGLDHPCLSNLVFWFCSSMCEELITKRVLSIVA